MTEEKSKTFVVRIPLSLHKRFKLLAVENEVSMNAAMLEMIENYVENGGYPHITAQPVKATPSSEKPSKSRGEEPVDTLFPHLEEAPPANKRPKWEDTEAYAHHVNNEIFRLKDKENNGWTRIAEIFNNANLEKPSARARHSPWMAQDVQSRYFRVRVKELLESNIVWPPHDLEADEFSDSIRHVIAQMTGVDDDMAHQLAVKAWKELKGKND